MNLYYSLHTHTFYQTIQRVLLLAVFELFFIVSSYAIKPYQPILEDPLTESWRWQTFSALNGQDVRCMTEGADKVMWFGLKDGIMKFNGYNWEKFDRNKGFYSQEVESLITTKNNFVYARTSKGLFVYKKTNWEQVYPFKKTINKKLHPINALCELHDGSILASIGYLNTEYSGLLLLKNQKVTLFCAPASFSLYKKEFPSISIKIIPEKLLLNKHLSISSVYEDKQNRIWFVNFNSNTKARSILFYATSLTDLANSKLFSEKDGLEIGRYSIIKEINDGSIWLINRKSFKGIMTYKNNSWERVRITEKISPNTVFNSVLSTPNDGIWVGGVGVLYVYKNGIWKSYRKPEVLIPNANIDIFRDSRGFFWILGYRYELTRNDYTGGKWNTYKYINYECSSSDKKQWFISVENRVVVKDGEKWYSYGTEDGLPEGTNRIFITSTGTIWVSGSDKNIAATAYFDGKIWHKQLHPSLSWGVGDRSFFEDSKQRLWIGCSPNLKKEKGQKGGALCLENPKSTKQNWKQYPSTNSLKFLNVYGMGESKDHRIWAGGSMLRYFEKGKWHEYTIPQQTGYIDMIKNKPNGLLWVGTRIDGLYAYDGERWKNYNYKNGLISNCIIDLLIVSDSNVWVATDKDFSHFDGKSWTNNVFPKELTLIREGGSFKYEKDLFVWINSSSYEWKRRFLMSKPLDNQMKESFKTSRYEIGRNAPETYITSYYDEVPYSGNTYITWTGEDLWHHTPSNRLSYSYRFNGGEWSPFSEETSKTFMHLESGDYVMEVRARDLDFNFDPTPARIEFVVAPPVWMQFWFISLILVFIFIIVIYQLRIIRRNKKLNTAKLQLENHNRKISVQKDEIIKIAQREQENNQLRIKFFTNITHEFRTPLTLILGSLDRISNLDTKTEKQRLSKYLSMVHRNAQQLLRLINQLMDFRKAETSTMQLKASKGNVVKFTEYIVSSFQTLTDTHNISLTLNKEIDKISAWYDADKFEKILYNLISNAIKYTPENGSIQVSIKLNSSKDAYQIIVEDTGVGIPEDEIQKILEPFYQAKNTPARNEEGTGIGLALVNSLVELHHGSLSIQSNTKKQANESFNTSFTITLPLGNDLLQEEEMISEEENRLSEVINIPKDFFDKNNEEVLTIVDESAIKEHLKQKILVIDDNSEVRSFIKDELSPLYDLIEAVNGKEGLEKALEFSPDLVICDLMMPIMNGTEFCTQLKSDERLSHIPVILLTANNAEEEKIKGYETGADDYITKPFKTSMLELRIKNILDNRKLLQKRFKTEITLEPKSMNIQSIDAEFLERTIAAVDQNIKDENFDVEALSNLLNLSARQLHNKLTSLTDMSPGEFIRVYRLKRAAEALVKKKATISEVAYDFGFSNPKYFSKCFRQQFGITPSKYLEENS